LHLHLCLFFSQLLLADLLDGGLGFFSDSFFTFGQDHFDVTWVRHERIDSTVGSVDSSSVGWSLVDTDVFDEKGVDIERFKLGVGLGVSEKFQQIHRKSGNIHKKGTLTVDKCRTPQSINTLINFKNMECHHSVLRLQFFGWLSVFTGLLWPSTLGSSHTWCRGKLFGLGASADTSVESDEWNASFVLNNVLKVLLGLSEVHTFKHLSGFSGVLEVDSNILGSRFATLGRVGGFGHVPSHNVLFCSKSVSST